MKMTTVKLKPSTKDKLKQLKKDRETYDDVVERLADKNLSGGKLAEAYRDQQKYHQDLIEDWDKIQDGE